MDLVAVNLDARNTRLPHARTCVPGWRMPAKSVTLPARSAKLQGVPCSFESAVGSVQLFVQSERFVVFFSRPHRLRSALMSGYPAQESASTFNSIPHLFPCLGIRFTMPLAWTRTSSSMTGSTGSTRKTIGTRAAGITGRGISYRRKQCRISSCASRCSITGAPLRTFQVGVADRHRIGESTGAMSGKIVDAAGTTGTGKMFPGELHRHTISVIIHTSTIRVSTNSERYESGIIATSLERIWRATNLIGHSEARRNRTARMSRIAYPPFASGPMHRRRTAPARVTAQATVSRRTAETTMSDEARRHRPPEAPSTRPALYPALRFRDTTIRKFLSGRECPNTLSRRQTEIRPSPRPEIRFGSVPPCAAPLRRNPSMDWVIG